MANQVVFTNYHNWNSRVQIGSHKYASSFSDRGWDVLWVTHYLNLYRLIRQREDDIDLLKSWRHGVHEISSGFFEYTPLSLLPYMNLPFLRSRWLARNCLRFSIPSLRSALADKGFERPAVLWLSSPRFYSLTTLVKPHLTIYRVADENNLFANEPASSLAIEKQMCTAADIVFTTSKRLHRKVEGWGITPYYLPNGVDFDFFSAPGLDEPADIAAIRHPRVLFVGSIAEWFDFDSLFEACGKLPDYSFILVGPIAGDRSTALNMEKARSFPNIVYLGSKPFQDVRSYMRFCDVGIIPFKDNDLTQSVSPIKLFEYFASGMQVVARNLDEIRQSQSPAFLYTSPDEFIGQLRFAVQHKRSGSETGLAFAQENTWQKRSDLVFEVINKIRLEGDSKAGSLI